MALAEFMSDTHPDVVDMLVERWRTMSPGEKLNSVTEMSAMTDALAAAGVRRQHPHATDDEVRFEVIARRLDRSTMIQVYGERTLLGAE